MAVLVVRGPLLAVRQHSIGFLRFLEMLLRILAVRIAVGMVLHRELAICLLDFVVARVLRDAQNLVVIPFRHIVSMPPRETRATAPLASSKVLRLVERRVRRPARAGARAALAIKQMCPESREARQAQV
ncbi:hypothetical protein BMMON2_49890 [Burkholderia mallei]